MTLLTPAESERLPPPAARPRRRWRIGHTGWLAWLFLALFLLPVATVVAHIFLPDQGTWDHLVETVLPDYIRNSLLLALGVGLIAPVLGTGTAWLTTLCRFPGQRFFAWALILPLAVPGYVMAYAYTDFLEVSGPLQGWLRQALDLQVGHYWFPDVRSLGGAITLLSLVLYPYVYLLARSAFLEQSVCALEVGRTLGYGPWACFWHVALPLARPAIMAGAALVLMETLADYGTVAYFGLPTFTTGIVRALISMGDRTAAAQLSTLLLGAVFLVLLLERWSRRRLRFHHTSSKYRALPRHQLRGGRALLAVLACALPLLLGFLLPAALLLRLWLGVAEGEVDRRFLGWAGNSVTLAGIAACCAVALALLLAYGLRLSRSPSLTFAARLAGMGYAVPGTVIAIGTLIPLAAFDNALDAWLRARFGVSTGLLLTGSITALIFAYLVRFLSVALGTVEASLGKVRPSLDEAARTLGSGPRATLWRVHAPLVWGGVLTALLMVFVDVLKELPATLLLRPFDFDTLAVQAANFAADERLAEAAFPALAIVAVGLLPVLLLSRAIARARPGEEARS
jgi:iron(III) transport system permease protein